MQVLRGARLQLKAKGSDGQSPLSAVEIGSLGDVARSEMLCRNDAYIGVGAMPYEICVKNRLSHSTMISLLSELGDRLMKSLEAGREGIPQIARIERRTAQRQIDFYFRPQGPALAALADLWKAEEPLFFNGVELLDEEATLLEYNIVGPIVHLGGCAAFDLECELPSGRQLRESVTGDTTVAQLKGRITSEAGIPYLCMKLLAGDLELRDPVCLRHYDLAGLGLRVVTTRREGLPNLRPGSALRPAFARLARLPYIDFHFEDGPRTGALPAPTVAELVLPWRGQDADFPDFREVVAALFVLLHKYSHQEHLALGLLKVQAGLARSTRTVRVTEVSSCSFEDLKVAAGEADAFATEAEFTQVMVGDGDAQDSAGMGTAPAGFELMVCRCSGQDGKVMKWLWRRSCFSETFVRRAQDHLDRLLQLGRGSESRVREWEWTSQEEDRQVLGSFNLTTTTSSCETSVLDLVAHVAVDMPAHSAVVQDGDMLSPLSYAQLWSLAGRVAVALPDADVGAVAILLPRGVSMASPQASAAPVLGLFEFLFEVLALLGVWRWEPRATCASSRPAAALRGTPHEAPGAVACHWTSALPDHAWQLGQSEDLNLNSEISAPRSRCSRMRRQIGDELVLSSGENKCQVRLAITNRDLQLTWLPSPAILYMEDIQDTASLGEGVEGGRPTYAPDDVAYILFTSGSTGVPKGVLLTHQNVLAYTRWHVPYYQLTHEDRVPHAAGLSFDASLAEIWPTLSIGGCVLPVPDDNLRLLPEALCKWYAEAGATVAFLTTQLAEAVLAEPHYPSMRLRTL
ncbi:lgrC, partial [Symbiodinium necroappetens]